MIAPDPACVIPVKSVAPNVIAVPPVNKCPFIFAPGVNTVAVLQSPVNCFPAGISIPSTNFFTPVTSCCSDWSIIKAPAAFTFERFLDSTVDNDSICPILARSLLVIVASSLYTIPKSLAVNIIFPCP